jgi:uncharacterized protein
MTDAAPRDARHVTEVSMTSTGIWTADDILALVARQPDMMKILRTVEALDLPDCWVGAEFVRNVVWDVLHGRPWSPSYSDVDVVYFDTLCFGQESKIESQLRGSSPATAWSAKNQATMHIGNGDRAYLDTADALRHWPETCTAIALRTRGLEMELLASFAICDLVSLVVNPTPKLREQEGNLSNARSPKALGRALAQPTHQRSHRLVRC